MKQIISLLAFTLVSVFITNYTIAQGLAVNTTGAAANASAMLDVASTSQGVLVPRMTGAQKWAISSPVTGLMIFQTDSTSGFYYYTGSGWSAVGNAPAGTATGDMLYWNGSHWVRVPVGTNGQNLTLMGGIPTWTTTSAVPLVIGSSYGGGVIAYLLQPGDAGYSATTPHGLIAAPSDQSTGIEWFNGSNSTTGATGVAIGTGQANTTAIVTSQGSGSYAARLCDDLVLFGYSDWYLPSKDELNKLYINKIAIGGFANDPYWSSSENLEGYAWGQYFSSGIQDNFFPKAFTLNVRAVRSF
jgi:hypothetical protein